LESLTHRGYGIFVAKATDGWFFHARPLTVDLPILRSSLYRFYRTRDAAVEEAIAKVDALLA
jgi:hypothetical protein